MVKLGQTGNWLRVDAVKAGDVITIKNEGEWVENDKFPYPDGNPKQNFVIGVEYKGQAFKVRLNKFSRDEIVPVYGNDTAEWIGKSLKIGIENYRSLGKKGFIFSPVDRKDVDEDNIPIHPEPEEW